MKNVNLLHGNMLEAIQRFINAPLHEGQEIEIAVFDKTYKIDYVHGEIANVANRKSCEQYCIDIKTVQNLLSFGTKLEITIEISSKEYDIKPKAGQKISVGRIKDMCEENFIVEQNLWIDGKKVFSKDKIELEKEWLSKRIPYRQSKTK